VVKVKLNARHKRFANEYLIDLNATQAAIRSGYSVKTAKSQGNRLLTNVDLQAYISKIKLDRMDSVKIDAAYVLERHYQIDQLDVLDILDDELNLLPLTGWPKQWRLSLSGVDIMRVRDLESNKGGDKNTESVLQKIKWPDKLKNLELLGKHIDVNAYQHNINQKTKLDSDQPITRVFHVVE
tara:strand:- start:535 stop:1080 length:546 start_codon:yes stop_codon:yes gene_type:complete